MQEAAAAELGGAGRGVLRRADQPPQRGAQLPQLRLRRRRPGRHGAKIQQRSGDAVRLCEQLHGRAMLPTGLELGQRRQEFRHALSVRNRCFHQPTAQVLKLRRGELHRLRLHAAQHLAASGAHSVVKPHVFLCADMYDPLQSQLTACDLSMMRST